MKHIKMTNKSQKNTQDSKCGDNIIKKEVVNQYIMNIIKQQMLFGILIRKNGKN